MGIARLSLTREKPTPVGNKAVRAERRRRKAAKRASAEQRKAIKHGTYHGINNGMPQVVLRREPNVDKTPRHNYHDGGHPYDCHRAINGVEADDDCMKEFAEFLIEQNLAASYDSWKK